MGKTLYCSFCSKNQHEVQKLIAGPCVFICEECVFLCLSILFPEQDGLTPDKIRALLTEKCEKPE